MLEVTRKNATEIYKQQNTLEDEVTKLKETQKWLIEQLSSEFQGISHKMLTKQQKAMGDGLENIGVNFAERLENNRDALGRQYNDLCERIEARFKDVKVNVEQLSGMPFVNADSIDQKLEEKIGDRSLFA